MSIIRGMTRLYPFQKGRSRAGRALSKTFPVPTTTPIRIEREVVMELVAGHEVSKQLYFFGEHERAEVRFLKSVLDSGMLAIDIGADIGYMTILMAKEVGPTGRVHSFEPSLASFQMLRRNVDLNGMWETVTLNRMAVSNREGTARLANESDSSGNWLDVSSSALSSEEVECTTLDSYVAAHELDGIGLIKTDTEGAELLVLEGAHATLESQDPVLLVESAARHLQRFDESPESLINYLNGMEYVAHRLSRKGLVTLSSDDDVSNTNLVFLRR